MLSCEDHQFYDFKSRHLDKQLGDLCNVKMC